MTPGRWPGTAPQATLAAITAQLPRGLTTMLPTEDAVLVGEEMATPVRAALLAVHADRHRCQPLRHPAGPAHHAAGQRILVFDWCYHGTVDETFITLRARRDGRATAREPSGRRSIRT